MIIIKDEIKSTWQIRREEIEFPSWSNTFLGNWKQTSPHHHHHHHHHILFLVSFTTYLTPFPSSPPSFLFTFLHRFLPPSSNPHTPDNHSLYTHLPAPTPRFNYTGDSCCTLAYVCLCRVLVEVMVDRWNSASFTWCVYLVVRKKTNS